MKLTRTIQFPVGLFPLIPAVNVLFLVFMLFAMSSRYVLQPGIAVTLPFSSFTVGPLRQSQIVSITAAPSPAIFFRDQQMTFAEFTHRLVAGSETGASLIVKADRSAPYSLIMQVMNLGLERGYSVVLAGGPVSP